MCALSVSLCLAYQCVGTNLQKIPAATYMQFLLWRYPSVLEAGSLVGFFHEVSTVVNPRNDGMGGICLQLACCKLIWTLAEKQEKNSALLFFLS